MTSSRRSSGAVSNSGFRDRMERASAKSDIQTAPRTCERILIYDGQCRLCTTAKEGMERLGADLEVLFVPYQSQEAESLLGVEYRPRRACPALRMEPYGSVRLGLERFLPMQPGVRG